jgi:hypothetical protein
MYCLNNEANTWLRVILEIVGDIDVGDEFVHCGHVFTSSVKKLQKACTKNNKTGG